MSVGKLYGTFVVEGSLAEGSETVSLVRHRVDAGGAGGVVKRVVLPRSDSLQPGVMAARKLDAIALQDRVASDWPEVAPILDRPTTREQLREVLSAGEAWFITPRYDSSLQKLLRQGSPEPISAGVIWMICRSVARGALAFQQVDSGSGRRSHGNLKLSNVLIRGLPIRQGHSEIVVTDPAPGGRSDQSQAERDQLFKDYERDDIEALGRILFQLVAGSVMPENTDWSRIWETPEAKSKRWRKTFRGAENAWRAFCRELLDVRKTPDSLSLASVEKRLVQLEPKEPTIQPMMLGVAAGVVALIAGVIIGIWVRKPSTQIIVDTSLPSVDVFLTPVKEGAKRVQLERAAGADNHPGLFSEDVKLGRYLIEAVPTGEFAQLLPVSTNVNLADDEPRTVVINFEWTPVELTSEPPGAEVQWKRSSGRLESLGRTPVTVNLPPDGRFEESEFQFASEGYTRQTKLNQLEPGTNVTVHAVLSKLQLGSITVDFKSVIDHGWHRKTIFLVNGEDRTSTIAELVPYQKYQLTIQPPVPWPQVVTNISFPPEPPHRVYSHEPPYGTLVLNYQDVEVRKAAVWLLVPPEQEYKLGTVENEFFRLPAGRYSLKFELDGVTNMISAVIQSGRTNAHNVVLQRAPNS